MDYLMGYPTTKHQHAVILVVVNKFSKMDILIPCKKTMLAQLTAQVFFEHVWEHYGLPTTIISNRDFICQHLFANSLETARHNTFFVNNLPFIDIQIEGSYKTLGSTTTSHVQPKESSNMG